MKTAYELFNWFFKHYEKTSSNKNRLDAADLKICIDEHDREIFQIIDDIIKDNRLLSPEVYTLTELKRKLKRLKNENNNISIF